MSSASLLDVLGSGARGAELELWSPRRLASNAQVLAELRRFRRAIYEEFGFLNAAHSGATAEAVDRDAWHLLATRPATRELVGCIRFILFGRLHAATLIDRLLANSGCGFSSQDRGLCRAALNDYCEEWLAQGGPFVQIGGLAVGPSARRSALAPVLCLSGNAFMRAWDSRFGVIFGSERTSSGGQLYAKAGCAPIALGNAWLPPLADRHHDDRALVMRCNPHGVRADLQPEVEALRARFARNLEMDAWQPA